MAGKEISPVCIAQAKAVVAHGADPVNAVRTTPACHGANLSVAERLAAEGQIPSAANSAHHVEPTNLDELCGPMIKSGPNKGRRPVELADGGGGDDRCRTP